MDLYGAWMRRDAFSSHLRRLEREMVSSEVEKLDHCNQCGLCCWRRPCTFTRDDLNRAAAHLGMEVGEFFKKYMAVDEFNGEIVPIAIRKSQTDLLASYVPAERTYDLDSPCVFFDEESKKCGIHEAKPVQGARFECWTKQDQEHPSEEEYCTRDELEALGWDGVTEDW